MPNTLGDSDIVGDRAANRTALRSCSSSIVVISPLGIFTSLLCYALRQSFPSSTVAPLTLPELRRSGFDSRFILSTSQSAPAPDSGSELPPTSTESARVVVAHISLKDRQAIADILRTFPENTIIVVASDSESHDADDAATETNLRVIPASCQHSDLIEAVRSAVAQRMPQAQRAATCGVDHLSKREQQVLYLIVDGLPNRTIAKKLLVSPRTIETHRTRILKKLGLKSTAELVRYSIRNNLIAV